MEGVKGHLERKTRDDIREDYLSTMYFLYY